MPLRRRRVRREIRRRDDDGRVFGELADRAVIRMVVPWTVGQDDVGLPVANQIGHLLPRLEIRHQLAVVDVEHLGLDAELRVARLDFRLAPLRERAAGLREMADVAVGQRDELDLVPRAANRAAVPANFSSASSGCAPKAMIRSCRWADPGPPAMARRRSREVNEPVLNASHLRLSTTAYPHRSTCGSDLSSPGPAE